LVGASFHPISAHLKLPRHQYHDTVVGTRLDINVVLLDLMDELFGELEVLCASASVLNSGEEEEVP
jgi:hypothetical protein